MARRSHHGAWNDRAATAASERAPSVAEMKQTASQKEAITAQMIGIISSRLDALQTLANNRKLGLESDLRVNADYCSKMVPGLQDPYENRANANGRAKTASSTTLASNQVMMERLFGPDDKSRLRTQVLKKNKAELQKSENRRNTRVHLEKQLQASIEGHITRTVDNYVHGLVPTTASDASTSSQLQSTALIQVNAKLLLLHTGERMRVTHGKKNFKRFLLSDLSCTLFEDIFWLVFCHFFQRNSTPQQQTLTEAVSVRYVKILSTQRTSNSDYLFRVYPYAVASGVCWGFHYVFPGSRHLYSTAFKNDVFLFVGQLLLGLRLCPVSVLSMRRKYFPEEMLDEATNFKHLTQQNASTSNGDPSATTGSSIMPDLSALLPRLKPSHSNVSLPNSTNARLQQSASESYLLKQTNAENSIAKILHLPTAGMSKMAGDDDDCSEGNDRLGGNGGGDSGGPRMMRTHQQRVFFNASQLSPLMKGYLGAENKNIKKPSYLVRTTPFKECAIGGEDTFHKYYSPKGQKNYGADAQREHDKCRKDIQRVQHDTRRELSVLNESREIVLASGKKALQAYCTLLLSKNPSGDDEDDTNGGGGAASGSGSTNSNPLR